VTTRGEERNTRGELLRENRGRPDPTGSPGVKGPGQQKGRRAHTAPPAPPPTSPSRLGPAGGAVKQFARGLFAKPTQTVYRKPRTAGWVSGGGLGGRKKRRGQALAEILTEIGKTSAPARARSSHRPRQISPLVRRAPQFSGRGKSTFYSKNGQFGPCPARKSHPPRAHDRTNVPTIARTPAPTAPTIAPTAPKIARATPSIGHINLARRRALVSAR